MKEVGYYNGTIGPLSEISCPILDRAVYFGDGCYDATYVQNGVIFALEDHFDRFYNSCRLLRISFQYSREELEKILYSLVEAYDGNDGKGILYWQTSRGTALRNHLFPDETEVKPNLMAILMPMDLSPKEKEFHTITLEDTRFLHCNIKTLNLIPSVIANQKAKEAGCQEVIFHRGDRVTEMAHSNVSFLIDGTLVYHPFDNKVLPGIAIKHLIKTAEKLGVPTRAEEITVTEAMNADELIITSSGTLCNRITEVDKIPVGGKADELFHKLQDAAWDEFMVYTKQK